MIKGTKRVLSSQELVISTKSNIFSNGFVKTPMSPVHFNTVVALRHCTYKSPPKNYPPLFIVQGRSSSHHLFFIQPQASQNKVTLTQLRYNLLVQYNKSRLAQMEHMILLHTYVSSIILHRFHKISFFKQIDSNLEKSSVKTQMYVTHISTGKV